MRLRDRSSGISSNAVSTNAPKAAPRPPRLLVSTRHSRPPASTAPASTRVTTDLSLITTMMPIGQQAGDEAGEVVRVAEGRPHGARRAERRLDVEELDPVPMSAELDVGRLDQAVEHDEASAGEEEGRQDATEI